MTRVSVTCMSAIDAFHAMAGKAQVLSIILIKAASFALMLYIAGIALRGTHM